MLQCFEEVWSCTTFAAQWCIANKTLIGNDGAWTYNIIASGKNHSIHYKTTGSPLVLLHCTQLPMNVYLVGMGIKIKHNLTNLQEFSVANAIKPVRPPKLFSVLLNSSLTLARSAWWENGMQTEGAWCRKHQGCTRSRLRDSEWAV